MKANAVIEDYHVHSAYSDDSTYPLRQVVMDSIDMGIKEICFTDHVDYGIKRDWDDSLGIGYRSGAAGPEPFANVDYPKYADEISGLQKEYGEHISIKLGLEFGVQVHTIPLYEKLFSRYPFDFIILSIHQVGDKEFWTQEFQTGQTQDEYR